MKLTAASKARLRYSLVDVYGYGAVVSALREMLETDAQAAFEAGEVERGAALIHAANGLFDCAEA